MSIVAPESPEGIQSDCSLTRWAFCVIIQKKTFVQPHREQIEEFLKKELLLKILKILSSQGCCLFGSCYVLKSSPWQTGFVVLCGGKEEPRGAAMENTTPNTTLQNFTPTLRSIIVGITLKGGRS